jgi:hypothetical protein
MNHEADKPKQPPSEQDHRVEDQQVLKPKMRPNDFIQAVHFVGEHSEPTPGHLVLCIGYEFITPGIILYRVVLACSSKNNEVGNYLDPTKGR